MSKETENNQEEDYLIWHYLLWLFILEILKECRLIDWNWFEITVLTWGVYQLVKLYYLGSHQRNKLKERKIMDYKKLFALIETFTVLFYIVCGGLLGIDWLIQFSLVVLITYISFVNVEKNFFHKD